MPIQSLVHYLLCNFELFTICLTLPIFDQVCVKSNIESYYFSFHFEVTLGTGIYFGVLFSCVYDFFSGFPMLISLFSFFRTLGHKELHF